MVGWSGAQLVQASVEQVVLTLGLVVIGLVIVSLVKWRHSVSGSVARLPPLPPLPPFSPPQLPSLPEQTSYTHAAAEFIDTFGKWNVVGLKVRRTPVTEILHGLINAASGGRFLRALQKLPYNRVFHLGIVIELERTTDSPHRETELLVEKNEVICITWPGAAVQMTEYKRIRFVGGAPSVSLTLESLLRDAERAVAASGHNFFAYDAFRGQNCQDFVLALLAPLRSSSSPIENIDEVAAFVKQNTDSLVNDLTPQFLELARAVTDAGAVVTGAVDNAAHHIKTSVNKLRQQTALPVLLSRSKARK